MGFEPMIVASPSLLTQLYNTVLLNTNPLSSTFAKTQTLHHQLVTETQPLPAPTLTSYLALSNSLCMFYNIAIDPSPRSVAGTPSTKPWILRYSIIKPFYSIHSLGGRISPGWTLYYIWYQPSPHASQHGR